MGVVRPFFVLQSYKRVEFRKHNVRFVIFFIECHLSLKGQPFLKDELKTFYFIFNVGTCPVPFYHA